MFINREWATPLVIGSFLLSGLTGLALFLGVSTFFGTTAHQYFGIGIRHRRGQAHPPRPQ